MHFFLFLKTFVFQIHVFIKVNMEPMKIDSPSDKSGVKVKNCNTKDFFKSHKKSVSLGVIVIGVLAIVSSVFSVTGSSLSSQQG